VGFACSLGVDMGFNSGHHLHGNGKHHEHNNNGKHHEHAGTETHHEHNRSRSHNHEARSHHHSGFGNHIASLTSPRANNCCTDLVVGFQSLDKVIVKGI